MFRSQLVSASALLSALALVACGGPSSHVNAPLEVPPLGTAQSFAVLAGSTVTNTGATIVHGNLGVHPGAAVTGFPPGLVEGGTTHAADAVALQAQADVVTAYLALQGQACNFNLTGQDLGGLTLTQGVYCFTSSAQLTGDLTLDAEGHSDAVFIFQTVSGLNTASNSSIHMINGGGQCNVFWQVGSSATLGTGTAFVGNIFALTSISLATGASMTGRALARNGAVTLDNNLVSTGLCEAVQPVDAGVVAPDLLVAAADLFVAPVDATTLPDLIPIDDLVACDPLDL